MVTSKRVCLCTRERAERSDVAQYQAINHHLFLITRHATAITYVRSACGWCFRRLLQLYGRICWAPPSVVADPAFVRLLSSLGSDNKVPSLTQLASLLANRHQCAKEELKCLLRAQATLGVAVANDGSTSWAIQSFMTHTHSSLSGPRMAAVEQRSWISSLQREIYTHSRQLGRCFPGCSEKIWAVDGLAFRVSERHHRNQRWNSQQGCLGQTPWWCMRRRMGKSTSFRPPYGMEGCSAVTRNNWASSGEKGVMLIFPKMTFQLFLERLYWGARQGKPKEKIPTSHKVTVVQRNHKLRKSERCPDFKLPIWKLAARHYPLFLVDRLKYGRQYLFTVSNTTDPVSLLNNRFNPIQGRGLAHCAPPPPR